jgi:hypothetical protein
MSLGLSAALSTGKLSRSPPIAPDSSSSDTGRAVQSSVSGKGHPAEGERTTVIENKKIVEGG